MQQQPSFLLPALPVQKCPQSAHVSSRPQKKRFFFRIRLTGLLRVTAIARQLFLPLPVRFLQTRPAPLLLRRVRRRPGRGAVDRRMDLRLRKPLRSAACLFRRFRQTQDQLLLPCPAQRLRAQAVLPGAHQQIAPADGKAGRPVLSRDQGEHAEKFRHI